MKLNLTDLDHLLKLSRLSINTNEKEEYLNQLKRILDHMKEIDKYDLDNIEPSAYNQFDEHYLREDEPLNSTDLLLEKNAPKWENNAFHVPKIKS